MKLFVTALSALVATSALATEAPTPPPAPVVPALKIAAAADLAFAFKELAGVYGKKTGQKVELTLGSTGLLAKQLAEGAPFDAFAAANVSFVDDVVKAGACDGNTKSDYAVGRIAMWSSKSIGVAPPTSLQDLTDKRFVKIAIASPAHAPYGKAAQEALMTAGVWDAVKPKLVYGENVQQTLQFAQSGNAEVAIVSLSLTIVSEGGNQTVIDADQHKPIRQALVVCGKPGPRFEAARGFTAFVSSPEGRAVMKKYGFLLPGETLAAR